MTPFIVSLGYGSLLLAILWGHAIIRAPFEFYPLRFIGLISFSLYLWHDPFIHPLIGLSSPFVSEGTDPLAFIADTSPTSLSSGLSSPDERPFHANMPNPEPASLIREEWSNR